MAAARCGPDASPSSVSAGEARRAGGRMEAERFDPEIMGRRWRPIAGEDNNAGQKQESGGGPRGPHGRAVHWVDRARKSASLLRSRLPPERITPTRFPEKAAFLWRTAAAPATPEGSTRIFILSSIQQSVSAISSSDTSRMPATDFWTIGNVSFPGLPTWRASAIVRGMAIEARL